MSAKKSSLPVLVTALLLTGCASTHVSGASTKDTNLTSGTASNAGHSTAVVSLRTPVVDKVGGVNLYPPPADASPTVTEAAAEKAVAPVAGALPKNYQARLALLRDTQTAVRNADGTSASRYTDRLVWAFIGQGHWSSKDSHLGAIGPDGKPVTPGIAEGTRCTGVWLVDATTGSYLEGYSYCPPAR